MNETYIERMIDRALRAIEEGSYKDAVDRFESYDLLEKKKEILLIN